MKKFLLFLLVPFSAWATELHPEQECETLKTILLEDLSQYYSFSANLRSYSNRIMSYTNYLRNNNDFLVGGSDYAALENIDSNASEVYRMSTVISNQTDFLSGVVSNVVCSACPVDSSGDPSCCEDVIARLESISQDTASIRSLVDSSSHLLDSISDDVSRLYSLLYISMGDITNQLAYVDFLLEHGFSTQGDLFSFLGTNLSISSSIQYSPNPAYMGRYQRMFLNGRSASPDISLVNTSHYSQFTSWGGGLLGDVLSTLIYQGWVNSDTGVSLNNYAYDFRNNSFPVLTNTVGHIHRDTTNFFSFFSGEIGVQSVLQDWTNVEADGTYYEFLTNHYISVVKGGPLSGNSSTKTNWFSRIETLLASLVFLDSSNTNAYDSVAESVSNEVNRVKDSFNSTLDGVSSAPSTQMELAADIERSMYQSLLAFSKAFSSASLPSSVQLLHVSKTSGSRSLSSDVVDVTVSVEGKLMDFVEVIRSATTLCWVFLGLWFMFKFSVWTVKKIYMLIRYIIDFFNMVSGGK